MKKLFFLAAVATMSLSAMAMDLFSGSKHVSWGDGGLQFTADKFADAKAGDKLVVTFTGASDGIEFKVMNKNFDHLAGSREAAWISGDARFEQFLTPAAVEGLKAHGLEIIGANFTATKVELLEGKTELKAGYTVWTGYFWADNDDCHTLELYRDGYCNVDMSKYIAVRFYAENKETYALNFLKTWEEGGKFADEQTMTAGDGYLELALTNELRTAMSEAGHWMIQYCGVQTAFNVTDIVLVEETTTAISNVNVNANANVRKVVENGQVVVIKNGVRYNALGTAL